MTDADPSREIATLRDNIQAGDRGGSDADRELLLQMSDNIRLIPSEVGDHRHLKILRHCTRMAEEVGDLEDALEDEDAAQEIVRWIHSTYDNEHTNQDYRTALRSFGRHVLRSDEPPESLAWIPTGTSNDFDPVPSERDLLNYEADVAPMVEQCHNARDACLVKLQFEAGLRGGELYDLRIGDIFDSDHSIGLHVDGKEGERTVHLIISVPELQQWLINHPANDDPEAPLWSKLNEPERPSYATFLNYFKYAAERVDVAKEVTPTALRKSNTRWLVRLGFSQAEIEDRQGRKRGSDHTARYMAHFGDDSLERSYAVLHGKAVETDEPDEVAPVTCPRCDRETPQERDRCMWCGFALSHDAAREAEEKREAGLRALAQLVGEEDVDEEDAVEVVDSLIDERVQAALDEDRHS